MAEEPDRDRLKALEARIAEAKKVHAPQASEGGGKFAGAELAWRMVSELVAGLLIGLVVGYGLDVLFGTLPLFLVIFIGFGFAGGVKVMLRTAKSVGPKPPGTGGETKAPGGSGDEGS